MASQIDIERARAGKDVWNAWARSEIDAGRTPATDFSKATLDISSFEEFVFPGHADFSDSTFTGRVSFGRARFMRNAIFKGTTFAKMAYFTKAEFEETASFTRAHFGRHAGLAQIRVAGNASFNRCSFASNVKLNESVFEKTVDFSDAHVVGSARFISVQFVGEAQFSNALFDSRASLYQSQFMGNALFNATIFKGITTNLTFIQFARVPDFRTTRFYFPPNFQGTRIAYQVDANGGLIRWLLRCASDSADAARYRRLKQLAAETKDHEKELEFFAYELRAKRFHETYRAGPISLNVLYDWLSNYGRSVARPFLLLVLMVVLSAWSIGRDREMMLPEMLEKRGALMVAAITNSALLFGSDKSALRDKAFKALDRRSASSASDLAPDVIAYAQSAVSVFLVFLIGLALRNRFRVGGSG